MWGMQKDRARELGGGMQKGRAREPGAWAARR